MSAWLRTGPRTGWVLNLLNGGLAARARAGLDALGPKGTPGTDAFARERCAEAARTRGGSSPPWVAEFSATGGRRNTDR